eukprot:6006723-Pyramimonas_sp.AAC.1
MPASSLTSIESSCPKTADLVAHEGRHEDGVAREWKQRALNRQRQVCYHSDALHAPASVLQGLDPSSCFRRSSR